jgi:hypothetical protein
MTTMTAADKKISREATNRAILHTARASMTRAMELADIESRETVSAVQDAATMLMRASRRFWKWEKATRSRDIKTARARADKLRDKLAAASALVEKLGNEVEE